MYTYTRNQNHLKASTTTKDFLIIINQISFCWVSYEIILLALYFHTYCISLPQCWCSLLLLSLHTPQKAKGINILEFLCEWCMSLCSAKTFCAVKEPSITVLTWMPPCYTFSCKLVYNWHCFWKRAYYEKRKEMKTRVLKWPLFLFALTSPRPSPPATPTPPPPIPLRQWTQ